MNKSIFNKFGKLLKYDFLESFYSILLINGILLALMAISKAIINSNLSIMSLILALAIPVGYLLSLVFLTITIIRLLYNRIFTPDGYLTFALPVSLDAILISKILVSSIYVILSSFVIVVWAVLISEIMNIADIAELIRLSMNEALFFVVVWGISGVVGVLSMSALVLLILAILHIGAITRFRTLCGIALFMFFMIIESIGYGFVLAGNPLDSVESLQSVAVAGLVFNIFKTAIYYLLARYLIANKLEI